MSTDSDKLTVVNIVSPAYSGGTWVNLMLGTHPSIFTIGEMREIAREGRAECVLHEDDCPLWSQFDPASDENPFFQLNRLTGKRVFVARNAWRFLDAQRDPRIESKFVELIRDGRAVMASTFRKFPGTSSWSAARRWAKEVRRNRRMLRTVPPSDRITVLYERIVADTATELQRLCDCVGVPYDPMMQQYWEAEHHYIGGNRSTMFGMLTKRGVENAATQIKAGVPGTEPDVDYYREQDPANFVDERWKQELTVRQQLVFQCVAGRFNHAYGYAVSPGAPSAV